MIPELTLTLPVRRSHLVGSEELANTHTVAVQITEAKVKCGVDRAAPVLFTTQASIKAREVPHRWCLELITSV